MPIPASTFLPTQLSLVLSQPKGFGDLLQTSGSLVDTGPALTKAMRIQCPCFRIIGTLWGGDKPPQTPGTVPWARTLVTIGWKGPLGQSHLAIPNPSHMPDVQEGRRRLETKERRKDSSRGGRESIFFTSNWSYSGWSRLPGMKSTTIKGFVPALSPLLCSSHP